MAEVVTGEAVVLEVPCARFPSRLLALGIDLAIQLAMIFVLLTVVGLSAAACRHAPQPSRRRARRNTARSIGWVSFPVYVFCWLGW